MAHTDAVKPNFQALLVAGGCTTECSVSRRRPGAFSSVVASHFASSSVVSDDTPSHAMQTAPALAPPERPAATAQQHPPAPRRREARLRDFYANVSEKSQQRGEIVVNDGWKKDTNCSNRLDENEEMAKQLRKQANDVYDAGDFEGACELYTNAIKLAPSAVLYANRAAAHIMLGWWDQALRDSKAALRRDADNVKALERQARVLLVLDRIDEAQEVASKLERRTCLADTTVTSAGVAHVRLLAERAKSPQALSEVRAVIADIGEKAASSSPLGARLRKQLVRTLVESSDALESENQHTIDASNAVVGNTEEEARNLASEALKVTGELLEDSPEDAEVRYWQGRALVRLGRREDAVAQLQRVLQDVPAHQQARDLIQTMNSLEDVTVRGNIAYRDGCLTEAIKFYTQGVEQDLGCVDIRTLANLHYNRSSAYRKLGEFSKALEDVESALALNPRWTKALYRRGILLLESGRAAEALTDLKVVQRADPLFDADLDNWLRRAHNWLAKHASSTNYYEFMRVPMDATQDDIRKQYKRLCLLWHPDKNPNDEGRSRFEELQEAFHLLMDCDWRENYDFGGWKDKPVRHHVKQRMKARDVHGACAQGDDGWEFPYGSSDRHLEEDENVESIFWGGEGCPQWLKDRREKNQRQRLGGYTS
eukprot:TRINITY_DN27114_c0_g1_i1.p1 TRINITY_DN27114_c0_g1~~TRINITY_DN27114_c0_g1_i1.p1  ORF type:complete len:665 (-),score=127.97 TRINITY_DN27114_c0_g1_i1:30-1991(-)